MTMTPVPIFNMGALIVPFNITTTLDANGEKIGYCGYFATPDGASRSITHICFATRTVATGGDILAQIESIDAATGLYNGIIAAGASGTQAVASSDDNTWFEKEITTPYSFSGGWLAVTLALSGSGNIQINKAITDVLSGGVGAWVVEELGGAAAAKAAYKPNCALKCSDGSYLIPLGGDCRILDSAISINTGSNPRYVGNKIVCGLTSRLIGFQLLYIDLDYNLTIKLVDASGNMLKADDKTTDMSLTIDSDYRRGSDAYVLSSILFPAPKTLTASTAYYLINSPESASNLPVSYLSYNSEALKNIAHRIPASGWSLNYMTSPSAWSITETAARIAGLYPVFDQIDIPSGGAGGGLPILGGSIVR